MIGRLFGRPKAAAQAEETVRVDRSFADQGFTFRVQGVTSAEWLATPFLYPEHAELGALLAQLFEEGYGSRDSDHVVLPWDDVYRLLGDPEYASSLPLLGLPPVTTIRPELNSKGSLTDPDFSIILSGWVDESGVRVNPSPRLSGAIAIIDNTPDLLAPSAWRVLGDIARFHQRPQGERTADSNRRYWGEIRRDAIAAQSQLSDFLEKTIVLTPEKLRLGLR